jgi:hypothetical protein
MAERAPILGPNMIPRKGTAAFEPIESAPPPAPESAPQPTPAAVPSLQAVHARRQIEPVPPPPLRRSMTYRPTVDDHDWLKDLSYRTRRSVQDLLDEAVKRLREDQS